jgi:hypothetical protein
MQLSKTTLAILKNFSTINGNIVLKKGSLLSTISPQRNVVAYTTDEKVVGWKVTSYDVEFLFAAQKHGYKIAEVEVEWAQRDLSMDVKKSSDKGRFIKESLDMLKELWRVKTNDLRGYYN